jgi:hypothetical protein
LRRIKSEMNRSRDKVCAFAECDANVEWAGRALQIVALAKIDNTIGFDLRFGD